MSQTADVVVVGAGVAGLAAAVALAGAGAKVTLLERRPFVGGRAYSYLHPALEETIDSQHVVLGCCTNLVELIGQAGAAGDIRWYDELCFLEPGGTVRQSWMRPGVLPAPMHQTVSFLRAPMLGLRDKVGIAAGLARFLRGYPASDAESFASWLKRTGQTERAIRHFWEPVVVGALNDSFENCSVKYAGKVFHESFLKSAEGGRLGIPAKPLSEFFSPVVDLAGRLGVDVRLGVGVDSIAQVAGRWRVQAGSVEIDAGAVVLAGDLRGTKKLMDSLRPAHGDGAAMNGAPEGRGGTKRLMEGLRPAHGDSTAMNGAPEGRGGTERLMEGLRPAHGDGTAMNGAPEGRGGTERLMEGLRPAHGDSTAMNGAPEGRGGTESLMEGLRPAHGDGAAMNGAPEGRGGTKRLMEGLRPAHGDSTAMNGAPEGRGGTKRLMEGLRPAHGDRTAMNGAPEGRGGTESLMEGLRPAHGDGAAMNGAPEGRGGTERLMEGLRPAHGDGAAMNGAPEGRGGTERLMEGLRPAHGDRTAMNGAPDFIVAPITTVHLWFDREVTELDHAVLLDTRVQWMFCKSRIRGWEAGRGSYLELVISASWAELGLGREAILAAALEEAARFFPAIRKARLVKSAVLKEARATFSVVPGLDRQRPAQRTEWPGLFVAGDWTATEWPSTMEGAVRSGRLAAGEVTGQRGRFMAAELPPSGLMRLLSRS